MPPIGILSVSSSSNIWKKLVWSKVNGHSKKEEPANAIKPKRLSLFSCIKDLINHLECSNLEGLISRDNILLDVSSKIITSLPLLE